MRIIKPNKIIKIIEKKEQLFKMAIEIGEINALQQQMVIII